MKKCFRSAKWIYALCLSKKSKILSLAYLKADDSTLFLNRDIHMYDKCMTNQKENSVTDICNTVSVRSEADSNRCTRFCRPLPSHSAIRPKTFVRSEKGIRAIRRGVSAGENPLLNPASTSSVAHRVCKYTNISENRKTSGKLYSNSPTYSGRRH